MLEGFLHFLNVCAKEVKLKPVYCIYFTVLYCIYLLWKGRIKKMNASYVTTSSALLFTE